jgi:hypothetical protein
MPTPWFADRMRDRLLRLVVEGNVRSQAALAEALGVSKQRVRRILRLEGIEVSYRAVTTRDRLQRLASRGARPQTELARRLGVRGHCRRFLSPEATVRPLRQDAPQPGRAQRPRRTLYVLSRRREALLLAILARKEYAAGRGVTTTKRPEPVWQPPGDE